MNRNGAKHPNQANEVLYLNKGMGGRGLKILEQTYKETKIKVAIKILEGKNPQVKLVRRCHEQCELKNRMSIFHDAKSYAEEMGLRFETKVDSYSR